jgi:hypothetical protein
LHNLLSFIKSETGFQEGKQTFWKIVKVMEFNFKKCKNKRSLLIENCIPCCVIYLKTLRNNKKEPKKPVVYIDVTQIHTQYTVTKVLHDKALGTMINSSAGQRAIAVYAGG